MPYYLTFIVQKYIYPSLIIWLRNLKVQVNGPFPKIQRAWFAEVHISYNPSPLGIPIALVAICRVHILCIPKHPKRQEIAICRVQIRCKPGHPKREEFAISRVHSWMQPRTSRTGRHCNTQGADLTQPRPIRTGRNCDKQGTVWWNPGHPKRQEFAISRVQIQSWTPQTPRVCY